MELRRDPRANLHMKIQVEGTDQEGKAFQVSGHTENVSKTGARIAVPFLVKPGELLEVSAYGRFRARARVTRVYHPARDGMQLIGITFEEQEGDWLVK
ncbi:MAG: PilZ domain-containing protein [Acidobacteria bacterium]|nr:PilZ domain-containing protein [Acidobacteriota bacterium]